MRENFFFSLRFRLVGLVLLAVLPALILLVYFSWEQRQQTLEETRQKVRTLALVTSEQFNDVITNQENILYTLSLLPQTKGRDLAALNPIFADLLKKPAGVLGFRLTDAQGRVLGGVPPPAMPTSFADRDWFRRLRETRRFQVSHFIIGKTIPQPLMPLAYPVLNSQGEIDGILIASFSVGWLDNFLKKCQLPPGTHVLLIDRQGTILANYPHAKENIGQSLPQSPLIRAMLDRQEGFVEDGCPGEDIPVIYAFTTVGVGWGGPLKLAVGLEKALVLHHNGRGFLFHLSLLGLAAGLALAGSLAFGHLLIRRPVLRILEATRRVAAGDLEFRTGLPAGKGELNRLGQGFDEMAATLQQREAERRQAEEELKTTLAFLENIIASSADPLITVDEHGRFTRWNQAAAECYGYCAEGLAGRTFFDLYVDKDALETMLGQLRRDGFVRGYEIDMQKKDKVIAPFSLSIRLLRDENGKSLGSVCVARDLTETRKALTALGQANARLQTLVEESDRRSREAALIISMSESLQSCLDAEEAYRTIAGFAQKLFSGQSGALFILAPSKNIVEVVTAWGDPLVTEKVFSPEDCCAIRQGRVYLSGQEIPCHHLPNLSAGYYVCLPLVAQGETFGLMHLQGTKGVTSLVGDQLLLLAKTVADHISLTLANLQLRETLHFQVIHDALTGLFNRRYLDETLKREISRVQRKKAPLGVIMMDLDHFKRFNDTYGHEAGDDLLQALGNYLQTQVRQEDIACRYGGEEFVLIMPEASLDVVQARAEEIREKVPQLQVLHRGQLLESITVSLGVAMFPDHGATGEDVLRRADDAMYQAKAAGRNRLVVENVKRGLAPISLHEKLSSHEVQR